MSPFLKKIECIVCGERFSSNYSLDRHFTRFHEDETETEEITEQEDAFNASVSEVDKETSEADSSEDEQKSDKTASEDEEQASDVPMSEVNEETSDATFSTEVDDQTSDINSSFLEQASDVTPVTDIRGYGRE